MLLAAFDDDVQAMLVARLRESAVFVPGLALVAVVDEAVVGFAMISRLEIEVPAPPLSPSLFEHPAVLAGPATFEALNLSPLAVTPAYQGRGIGRDLVEHAVAAADRAGAPLLVVEGDPAHYHRYGFRTASEVGLRRPSPLIPDAAFQVRPLGSFDPSVHVGDVRYPAVRHRSRVRRDATRANLRQVHLVHAELFDELAGAGHSVGPGDIGENVLTRGLPLLDLPVGTRLTLGASAVVELTGLRNPCYQLDVFQPGLKRAVLGRAEDGSLVRKTGVMAIVARGGVVRAGDPIEVTLPPAPHVALEPV
ncbi:MAG: GNAT family N-acetyltransferase [Actinobacteria bacterium]|nr:GNAT family N-acetyltransferase [Actinomycetota bacterium]